MRLFFALWPPAATAQALGRWAREAQRDAGGRATAEGTIHLTLAFLGEAEPGKAAAAARRVAGTAFELPIDTCRYWKHNSIVWVGPAVPPPELGALVAQLHGGLRQDGFPLEERAFAAHITLIRKAGKPGSLPALPAVQWPVSEFVLVRSATSREGSRYEVLQRFPLVA